MRLGVEFIILKYLFFMNDIWHAARLRPLLVTSAISVYYRIEFARGHAELWGDNLSSNYTNGVISFPIACASLNDANQNFFLSNIYMYKSKIKLL